MTDHLPECPKHGVPWESPRCICDRLRACEQRVREDDNRALWDQRQFNAGLAAARDAVADAPVQSSAGVLFVERSLALAAIDALRDAPHLDPCDCDDCVGKP